MKMFRCVASGAVGVAGVVLCFVSSLAIGDDARFVEFFNRASVNANFVQTAFDENGQRVSQTSGTMNIRRPDRMRWEYKTPESRVFILRQRQLLQYDAQLKQAVVSEVDELTAETPLGWLLGSRPDKFRFRRLQKKDARVDWFEAQPVTSAVEFERMEIGFDGDSVKRLILFDRMRRRTEIVFENVPPSAGDPFRIYLPAEVDILGDAMDFIAP